MNLLDNMKGKACGNNEVDTLVMECFLRILDMLPCLLFMLVKFQP